MDAKVRDVYKRARSDSEFLRAIAAADGDKAPGFFASSLEKHLFACIYYGWLVAKFGDEWRSPPNAALSGCGKTNSKETR